MNSRFAFQNKGALGRADSQTADRKQHWERVWRGKGPGQVSWFQPHLKTSLALITQAKLSSDAPIIDVGGGASTLVDSLLALGFRNLAVLDIAAAAIGHAKARLGKRAEAVRWIVGDVTAVGLSGGYDLWHDRAVFHFLTEVHTTPAGSTQQFQYVRLVFA